MLLKVRVVLMHNKLLPADSNRLSFRMLLLAAQTLSDRLPGDFVKKPD